MDEMESAEKEQALLLDLGSWEDIIEKKVKIKKKLKQIISNTLFLYL